MVRTTLSPPAAICVLKGTAPLVVKPAAAGAAALLGSANMAKALARNPGSRDEITSFAWRGSHPFRWNSQQLMELGLMEPGQWF